MTISAFRQIITPQTLRAAWDGFWRSSRSQTSAGVDGVTPAIFENELEKNLHNLYRALCKGYQFSQLKGHAIPKPDGKYRIICVPTVQDRIVQRLLANYLMNLGRQIGIINDVSYGFIKSGGSERKGLFAARDRAVELRCLYPWAYKSDICAFFDRIPRDKLVEQAVRALQKPSFRKILAAAASCEIDSSDPAIARIAASNGVIPGQGVRQGMPLSPVFANIILRDFDQQMVNRGVRLVRYADDFIAFASSEQECQKIDVIARDLLARAGFELPALAGDGSKTFIAAPDQDIEFLGLALSRRGEGGVQPHNLR